MLSADRVSFAYEPASPVLRAVSIEANPTEILGILGPNGSGKTTLLKVLAGLLRPQSGSVLLDGRPIAAGDRRGIARRMSIVPQETHLAFDYTVLEMVLMGRYSHLGPFELEGPEDFAAARRALRATGTERFEKRPFDEIPVDEWDYRKQRHLPDYCRLQWMVAADAQPAPLPQPLQKTARRLRQQFQLLAPSRHWHRAQKEGSEVDFDAYERYITERQTGQVAVAR